MMPTTIPRKMTEAINTEMPLLEDLVVDLLDRYHDRVDKKRYRKTVYDRHHNVKQLAEETEDRVYLEEGKHEQRIDGDNYNGVDRDGIVFFVGAKSHKIISLFIDTYIIHHYSGDCNCFFANDKICLIFLLSECQFGLIF